jgi:hypothetical protein
MASLLIAAAGAQAQRVDGARVSEYGRRYQGAPAVNVWIDRYSFRAGERIRAYFESEPGAYVTILRVSTAGYVRVLYPRTPTSERVYTSDRLVDDEVPYGNQSGFYLNEPEGIGFVFAVASYEPFNYRAFNSGGQWSTLQLSADRNADPFTAIARFVSRTLSPRADYSTDYIQYEVYSDGRYRDGRYGRYGSRSYGRTGYDDQYRRCLDLFGFQAMNYCRTYVDFGPVPFIVGRVARRPVPTTPTPAAGKKMTPPKAYVPDPVIDGGVAKPDAPSERVESRSEAGRPWWAPQSRDGARADNGERSPGTPRVEPRTPPPSEFRAYPQEPRIEVRPEPRREFPPQRRYEPALRAAPQRYEPAPRPVPRPKIETRRETRSAPPPAQHSAPVSKPSAPPPVRDQ